MSTALDLHRLTDALVSPEWETMPVAECPEPARVWEAACGRLAPEELGEIAEHAAQCPGCAHELRAARQVAEEIGEIGPFRAPQPRVWRLATKAGEAVSAALGFGRTAGAARPSRRIVLPAAATVALAAAASVMFVMLFPSPPIPAPGLSHQRADVAAWAVRLLVPDGHALPRDGFVLRWQGPEGARYDLRVMTTDLEEVVVVTDLRATELRLGEEALAGLAAGTTLLWQVEAYLPDGARVPSPTFRARLE